MRFLYGHSTAFYLGGVATFTTGIAGVFLSAAYALGAVSRAMLLFLGTLSLLPASELAIYLLQLWLTWVLPPRALPRMLFEAGIPDDCRTLVVVPMMLLTPDSLCGEVEKLEVRYLSNSGTSLHFSLLSDFTDAGEPEMPEDDNLIGLAVSGIEQLNARHGKGIFVLFRRPRVWCESEHRCWGDSPRSWVRFTNDRASWPCS